MVIFNSYVAVYQRVAQSFMVNHQWIISESSCSTNISSIGGQVTGHRRRGSGKDHGSLAGSWRFHRKKWWKMDHGGLADETLSGILVSTWVLRSIVAGAHHLGTPSDANRPFLWPLPHTTPTTNIVVVSEVYGMFILLPWSINLEWYYPRYPPVN